MVRIAGMGRLMLSLSGDSASVTSVRRGDKEEDGLDQVSAAVRGICHPAWTADKPYQDEYGAESGGGSAAPVPQNVSAFRNDAGYISEKDTEALLEGYTKESDVQVIAQDIVQKAFEQIPGGGLSAYEIAVEHGYKGTEDEWLVRKYNKT